MENAGVLLVNTGSPSSPSVADVRRYLGQFLMDECILDLPYWKRWLLVHGIILRTRPKHSAAAYRSVWTSEGSPLAVISQQQASRLSDAIGIPVVWAGRYGSPSIAEGLQQLTHLGCSRLSVLLLFPQYSLATTESISRELYRAAQTVCPQATLRIIPPFWNHPAYLKAWVASVKQNLPAKMDHLLISFHGLPERYLRKSDPTGHTCLCLPDCCATAKAEVVEKCYRAQSIQMSHHLVEQLKLRDGQYTVTYQSRLGREPWLSPSTHQTALDLARSGAQNLAIVTPSFVSDCLETLYEIRQELRQKFLADGGRELTHIPCLNESVSWMATLCKESINIGG